MQSLTPEALEEWRSNPTTEWVIAVLRKGAAANRKALERSLWDSGSCDEAALARVKCQIELIEDLTEATPEDFNDWASHFEEHKRD